MTKDRVSMFENYSLEIVLEKLSIIYSHDKPSSIPDSTIWYKVVLLYWVLKSPYAINLNKHIILNIFEEISDK